MTRIYLKTVYVPKTQPVAIDHCGPSCGFWCQDGRRCNQTGWGRGYVDLPQPEGEFPDVCPLTAADQGELFEVLR